MSSVGSEAKAGLALAKHDQEGKERNIALRFTPAQLGGGVEGDTVAEAMGQKIIDAICRYWKNQTPVTNIIRKVNGTLASAEAVSIIDVYSILFVANKRGDVKDKNNTTDMGIGEFTSVFKAWKAGFDQSALYRMFPNSHARNIDKLARACRRRQEAEDLKKRELIDGALPPTKEDMMARYRGLNISPDLIRKLHSDDCNAVRLGKFMVVDNRPAYVLFLDGEKGRTTVAPLGQDVVGMDIVGDDITPKLDPNVELEVEKAALSAEQASGFDAPPKTEQVPAKPKGMSLKEQSAEIRELTQRTASREVLDHVGKFNFTGIKKDDQEEVKKDLAGG